MKREKPMSAYLNEKAQQAWDRAFHDTHDGTVEHFEQDGVPYVRVSATRAPGETLSTSYPCDNVQKKIKALEALAQWREEIEDDEEVMREQEHNYNIDLGVRTEKLW